MSSWKQKRARPLGAEPPIITADTGEIVGKGYPTLYFTPASAKQRPGKSIGGLQLVLNFRLGTICAGTCMGVSLLK